MQSFYKDKVVVITGGTSGIGRSLVKALRNTGARVAVCARNREALQELADELHYEGLLIHQADVSRENECNLFIEHALKRFGKIDVLINNAGISMRALFKELDIVVLQQLMDVNFWGTVYCTKAALPALIRQKGVIVGISSIAGYRGLPARTGYSASKFAMQGFLEALRTELLLDEVHVMWVCPGFTSSNIRNTALNKKGATQGETPLSESELMSADEVAAAILQAIAKRKRTLILTFQGKLTVWLNKLVPGWLDRIVYNHFKKEPGSPLH